MTSDLSSPITVIGIQGVPVSTDTPEDGYVITYVAANNEYEPKPLPAPTGLRKDYFTSSGTWTCPEGVTNVLVIAAGGGGGGQGGAGVAYGGGGSIQQTSYVSVTPGLVYDIIIGSGGVGGTGTSNGSSGGYGSNGNSTTLSYSSTILYSTLGAGGGGSVGAAFGNSFAIIPDGSYLNNGFNVTFLPGAGGGNSTASAPMNGNVNCIGAFTGGVAGATITNRGGSGGGAGPQGNGGNGGNGAGASNAGNGVSSSNNTGAGGGGGGTCNPPNVSGNGGNGGSGYLYIIY